MPRAAWFKTGAVPALGALAVLLALGARRCGDATDFVASSRQLHVDFGSRLHAVRTAYAAQDASAHAQATLATLTLMNRSSIRALVPEVDRLIESVSKDGLAPYQSIAIEFAYRLARIDQPKARERFTALAKVVLSLDGSEKASLDRAARMVGYIRSKGRLAYRQFDADTVQAAGLIALSEFGRTQFRDGQSPQDLLRTVVMVWECKHGEVKDASRSDAGKKSCEEFVDALSSQLAGAGQGAALPAAMELLRNGSRMHTFTCGQRELSGQEIIEGVEAFAACLSSQGRPPRGIRPDGPNLSSYGSGTPSQLPGYTPVGDAQVTVRRGPNGDVGVQVAQNYANGAGGTATVTNYSVTIDGQKESGTFIVTDDGHETTHEERQNSSGEVTYSFTHNADGSTDTFASTPDGGSTTVTTSSDGVTHITHTDASGNVTTATVKENGDCVGAACQVSMPDDETGASDGCHLRAARPSGPRPGNLVDPIGPYIYPLPDSISGSPLQACLARSVGAGSTTPRCPPSVVLCLEPPPFGSCACGTPFHGGGPSNPTVCSQIQCPEGSSCDPQTGACRSYSSGGLAGAFSPGAQPFPRPPSIVLRP